MENMPIYKFVSKARLNEHRPGKEKHTSVSIWSQDPGVRRSRSPSTSLSRIDFMRPLICPRSASHCAVSCSSSRTFETILAPLMGGVVISARESLVSMARVFAWAVCVRQTTCRAPTRSPYRPKFLEKDCATSSSCEVWRRKCRMDHASLARSPVAKP